MQVTLDDLEMAVEFASSNFSDSEAYLDTENGKIYYVGDLVDEAPPDDIYDNKKYICVPSKSELDLGKSLAIQFTAESLPHKLDGVYNIFSRKGAHSKFKRMLESLDQLENWYAFEQAALKRAILDWCKENGINVKHGT